MLLVSTDDGTTIGNPFVDGARVIAEVIEQGRDRKVLVFRYKNKTRYRRRHGHRQSFTRLAIRQILTDGREAAVEEEKKPARPSRKPAVPKAKAESAAVEPEVTAMAAAPRAEASAAEAPVKPKRPARPRKAPATKAEGLAEGEDAGAKKPGARARTKRTETGE